MQLDADAAGQYWLASLDWRRNVSQYRSCLVRLTASWLQVVPFTPYSQGAA